MGGRRKSNKIQKKEKPILVKTTFDCRLCGFKNCVTVKIKKVVKQAHLECSRCLSTWDTNVKGMDEPIDVYHKWIILLKQRQKNPQPARQEPQFQEDQSNSEEDLFARNNKEGKNKKDNLSEQISEDSLNIENEVIDKTKKEAIDDSEDSLAENTVPKKNKGSSDEEDEEEEDEYSVESFEFDDEPQPNKKVKVEN